MPLPLSHLMYLATRLDPLEKEESRTHCHVCLQSRILTGEHVPPKHAFNDCPALWDRLSLERPRQFARPIHVRNGFRVGTLCAHCNNGVCAPYARAYVRFIRHLVESPRLFDPGGEARLVSIPADTLYVAKELATMVLAVERLFFAKHNSQLRDFVLGRDRAVDPGFRVYAFLVPDRPGSGRIVPLHGRVDSYAPGYRLVGGEISMFPFGFVYAGDIGPGYDLGRLTDITDWFTTSDVTARRRAQVSLYTHLTVIDSIQAMVNSNSPHPRYDDFDA